MNIFCSKQTKRNFHLKSVIKLLFLFTLASFTCFQFFTSCSTTNSILKQNKKYISRKITDRAKLTQEQLTAYFMSKNPDADENAVSRLAKYYIEESKTENINSDIAFAQMCHETGFLKFGNLVTPEMHNYCGLGAINKDNPGLTFETEQLGVRAHIQHLHAYATESNIFLKNELIDTRYKYVQPRGKAKNIFALAGTWAADKEYGRKLDYKLNEMSAFRKWKGR